MTIHKSKVAVAGCGLVGSSIAFSLLVQGLCDELLLLDSNREKALGEAMDLKDCIGYLGRNTRVRVGNYEDCGDADVVLIAAGPPPRPGQTRLDTLDASVAVARAIVEPIRKSGFDGIFLIVSNPVDVISHYVLRLSGFPKTRVIGSGTALDSSRLQNLLGGILRVDPRSVHALAMGEHGDSQMIPWSCVTVSGKPIAGLLAGGGELQGLAEKTARSGFEILNRKGATCYGIAAAATGILKAVLQDENRILPVSTLLEGEYGENNVFCGVPAILNRTGVADVLELGLTAEELSLFRASAAVIRDTSEKLFARENLL